MAEFSSSYVLIKEADTDATIKKNAPDFVAVDVVNLTGIAEKYSKSSPRVAKSFSRKGSQRTADSEAAVGDAGTAYTPAGVAHASAKIAVAGHVTVIEDAAPPFAAATTPTPSGVKLRRLGSSSVRRPSPWLDPRKVMFFFATLSIVGSLILLYFTLSINQMTDDRESSDSR